MAAAEAILDVESCEAVLCMADIATPFLKGYRQGDFGTSCWNPRFSTPDLFSLADCSRVFDDKRLKGNLGKFIMKN